MMQDLQRILLFQVLTYLGRNVHGSAIIRGTNAPKGSILYMASVQGHKCGGFLIRKDVILTAAHCANGLPRSVVLGTHNLRNKGQEIRIAKRCKHPQYVNIANGNDIMLLKLSDKAQLDNGVVRIPIPQDMNLTVGQKCQVFGWGAIRTEGDPVDDLMAVNVSIIDPQVCAQRWRRRRLPANITCAGRQGTNSGFCQGDSGGPLVCNDTAVGIASYNDVNCTYPTRPNVYTDISKFVDWIQNALTTNNCQE